MVREGDMETEMGLSRETKAVTEISPIDCIYGSSFKDGNIFQARM